jgi:hypothetical protein
LLRAQENLGAIQDNYSPVNGAMINPSVIVDQRPWVDINILGISAYARTNSLFLPNSYILSPNKIAEPKAKDPQKNLYGFVNAQFLGPSFSMVLREHAIGFHMAARGVGFIKNVPSPTATLIEELKDARVPDGRYFERNIRVKEMVWEEYGLTYGRILYKRNKDLWQGALTLNRLYGAHASGIYINNGELLVINEDGTLLNLDGKYWYNEPARKAGKGFSGSLGFTYKRMKKDISNYVPHSIYGSCVVAQYKHKVGIALTDIGAIRFKKAALFNDFDENTSIDSVETLADASVEAVALSKGSRFTAWLPTAATLQYDYNLERGFYFNAMLIQRLSIPSWYGTERASLYSVGLRYEHKVVSIAFPFSLHEYQYTQLGCSIRLWSLLIGTDNIMPFIKRHDVYAADLYLYFKIPIFKSPACRPHSEKQRKNRGVMEKFMCPVW